MDISTINLPLEPTEAEPHEQSPQASDPAFLQLLASFGLTPPLSVDAGTGLSGKDVLSAHTESLGSEPSGLVSLTPVTIVQGELMAAMKPNAEAVPDPVVLQEAAAQVIASAGQEGSDSAGTVVDALAKDKKDGLPKDQSMTGHAIPALQVTAVANSAGTIETISALATNHDVHAAPARLMDLVLSGVGQTRLARASAITTGSNVPPTSMAGQASENSDAAVKQTTSATSSLIWSAVLEPSDIQESGTEHRSASSGREGAQERFTSGEAQGAFATSVPAASSFSSQLPPVSTRTAPAPIAEAPTITAPQESPLPASVRFEVQPDDMGRIRVHLSVIDRTVHTHVVTDRVEAQDHLVKGSDRFEAGLAAHGLDVGRFHVDVQGQARQHGDRGATASSQDDLHRRHAQPAEQMMAERHAVDRETERLHGIINVFA